MSHQEVDPQILTSLVSKKQLQKGLLQKLRAASQVVGDRNQLLRLSLTEGKGNNN